MSLLAASLVTALNLTAPQPALAESSRTALDQVAPRVRADDPVARFTDPICVASAGLPVEASRVVADRIGEVAQAAGLRVSGPGCTPNLFVMFVPNSKATARQLFASGSLTAHAQSTEARRQILEEPGPARSWIETELRSRDGDRPSYTPLNVPNLSISTSSHLSLTTRRDILSATVLIDRDAVANRDLRQIADYAAMRALTGARPEAGLQGDSILNAFSAQAPAQLTRFDTGYLRGLYAGRADLPSTIKYAQIAATIEESDKAGSDQP